MDQIGIRIQSGPGLAVVIIVILAVVPVFSAAIRKRWLRTSGRDTQGAFWSTLSIALGVELGLFGALALSVSRTGAGKFTLAVLALVAPAVVGFARSSLRPGERAATFSKTFIAVLGLELAPFALGMLLYGASCLGHYGYVEF